MSCFAVEFSPIAEQGIVAVGNGCEIEMRPSSKDLAVFYYQLGTMLQAGVSIRNALTSLQQTGPRPLRKTVAFLGERVQEGEPLHQAVVACPYCRFARLDQHTLAVSEDRKST